MNLKTLLLTASFAALPLAACAATAPTGPTPIKGVKNIIVLINDGGGYTVYDATRLYNGRPLVTDGAAFKKVAVSTYPLRPDATAGFAAPGDVNNNRPIPAPAGLIQDPRSIYVSSKFWNTVPVPGPSTVPGYTTPFAQAGFSPITDLYPAGFQGYEFSRAAHPDSGNTASSIASAVKTYNNAINVNGAGEPQIAITDVIFAARAAGKSAGVVSTVEFSDATPAALGGAHNIARANRLDIANELFSTGHLDVIGGAGNPDYTDDSTLRPTPVYTWISAPLWADLKANTNVSGFNPYRFTLLQDRASIDAIANSTVKPPVKLAMIYQSFTSSQFNRTNTLLRANGTPIDAREDRVYGTPLKSAVPTQASLTIAALNTLAQNSRGFYLMSEAGAVDRAEHANDTARMIEELNASEETVQAIIDWVNSPATAATWDNTLLIVTADHDHLLYGPDGATVPFQPVQDRGPGNVPGNRWFGPNHGTGLVPLYAWGKGASQIVNLATDVDSYTDAQGRKFGHGRYLDQTRLGAALKATAAQN